MRFTLRSRVDLHLCEWITRLRLTINAVESIISANIIRAKGHLREAGDSPTCSTAASQPGSSGNQRMLPAVYTMHCIITFSGSWSFCISETLFLDWFSTLITVRMRIIHYLTSLSNVFKILPNHKESENRHYHIYTWRGLWKGLELGNKLPKMK